jgi:hypothetical protein
MLAPIPHCGWIPSNGCRVFCQLGGIAMSTIDKLVTDNTVSRLVERSERAQTAHLAHHLSSVALRQWERALTGMIAAPAAAALGVAAVATYGVSVLERVFEVLESAIGEIGRSIAPEDSYRRGDRTGDRPEARA